MNLETYNLFHHFESQGILRPHQGILISLSGGPDSVYLYHFLKQVQQRMPLRLVVAHFNHGLRPEAGEEADFCRRLAGAGGDEFILFEREEAFSGNLQEEARNWRKQNLFQCKQEHKLDLIALGHHQDDLSETILFRLLRGASLFSLQPMKEWDPPIFRPLLSLQKNKILTILEEEGLEYKIDPSNLRSDYQRNRIRKSLIPLMEELAQGNLHDKLTHLALEAGQLKEAFEQAVPEALYQADHLKYIDLQPLTPLYSQEVIHRWLRHQGVVEIHQSQILQIDGLIRSNQGGWQIHLKPYNIAAKNKLVRLTKN